MNWKFPWTYSAHWWDSCSWFLGNGSHDHWNPTRVVAKWYPIAHICCVLLQSKVSCISTVLSSQGDVISIANHRHLWMAIYLTSLWLHYLIHSTGRVGHLSTMHREIPELRRLLKQVWWRADKETVARLWPTVHTVCVCIVRMSANRASIELTCSRCPPFKPCIHSLY